MKININSVYIRKCNIDDLDKLLLVQSECVSKFSAREKDYIYPFDKEELIEILNDSYDYWNMYGAYLDTVLMAWILTSNTIKVGDIASYIMSSDKKCTDMDTAIVHPEYRGNKLQNILLSYVEEESIRNNIKYASGEVTEGNDYSLNNLLELGYEVKMITSNGGVKRNILVKELK